MDNILIVLLFGVVVTGRDESNKTIFTVWTIKGGLPAVVIKTFQHIARIWGVTWVRHLSVSYYKTKQC